MEKVIENMEVEENRGLEYKISRSNPEPYKSDERSKLRKFMDLYFAPKSFEKNGDIYKPLGVRSAQKIVMGTIGKLYRKTRLGKTANNYFIGKDINKDSLEFYVMGTWFNEAVHAPFMILSGTDTLDCMSTGNYIGAGINALATIAHFYLTILQRYNRGRVYRVMDKMKSSSGTQVQPQ